MRPLFLAAVLLLAPAARAQAPCLNGRATHQGTAYACSNMDLLARVPLEAMGSAQGNSLWGWTDPETGREVALMGLEVGLFFVDVTTPTAPALLGLLPAATAPSPWRDVRVYRNVAYVVSEAARHGLQVFDLTRLRGLAPDPSRRFEPDAVYRGADAPATLGSAHTLFVNEATGYAYAVGARDTNGAWACGGGLYMISLAQPLAPAFAGCLASEGYTHEVTCVLYDGPDRRYAGREICFAANPAFPATGTGGGYHRVTIVDVTDKASPRVLSEALYPNPGYAHQGWPTDDHRFFLFNDELDEQAFGTTTRTHVFDFADLERPDYLGAYDHGTRSIDHNLYVRGRFAYAANYTTGLRVLDLDRLADEGPAGIRTVAWLDTHPEHDNPVFRGAWNVYPFFESGSLVVSDMNRGLFVLRAASLPADGAPGPEPAAALALEAFPNPTAGAATVVVRLATPGEVLVALYDLLGRRVAVVHEGFLSAGDSPLALDARNLGAGIYVVQAEGAGATASLRLTLTR